MGIFKKMGASTIIKLLMSSVFCAWWTVVFYYCINIWSINADLNKSVLDFTVYASAFLMVKQYQTLVTELVGMCYKEGLYKLQKKEACFYVSLLYLEGLSTMASICFFLVWSIKGAIRMKNGLGPDEFFNVAAIITLVFTFLWSYFIIVLVILSCFCGFCTCLGEACQRCLTSIFR